MEPTVSQPNTPEPQTSTMPIGPDEKNAPAVPKIAEKPTALPETLVRHTSHTYADDLSKAMDTTEASTVQELLVNAREMEDAMHQQQKANAEKRWYSLLAACLIAGAVCAAIFNSYYTNSLTVPAEKEVSIGVFPTTTAIVANDTDIRQLTESLKDRKDLPQKKPFLLSLVTDQQSLTPLTSDETLAFAESSLNANLHMTLKNIHIGGYDTGTGIAPFVIAGVSDNEIATKELLIAEPSLLETFYKVLSVPIADYQDVATKNFVSAYANNIPIRTLSLGNKKTRKSETVILYGYVTDNILVITTSPLALKAVYDTVIRQQ